MRVRGLNFATAMGTDLPGKSVYRQFRAEVDSGAVWVASPSSGGTLSLLTQKYSWCDVRETGYVGFFLEAKARRVGCFALQ